GIPNFQFTFVDTNAPPNITAWYRVRAFNNLGNSAYSEPYPIAIMPPLESPLSATVFGDEVTLNWESSYLGFEGFVLERAPDAVGGPVNWTQVASFAPASMFGWTFEDKGLPANSAVWYRLRGYNWVGSSPYSYVSV